MQATRIPLQSYNLAAKTETKIVISEATNTLSLGATTGHVTDVDMTSHDVRCGLLDSFIKLSHKSVMYGAHRKLMAVSRGDPCHVTKHPSSSGLAERRQ